MHDHWHYIPWDCDFKCAWNHVWMVEEDEWNMNPYLIKKRLKMNERIRMKDEPKIDKNKIKEVWRVIGLEEKFN